MARGKHTCRILKEIRRQIADANDIEFVTTECRYKGDCLGTCPKCEAEVRYLEQQLRQRSLMGRTVALAGISAGMIVLSGCVGSSSRPQTDEDSITLQGVTIMDWEDSVMEDEGEIPEIDSLQSEGKSSSDIVVMKTGEIPIPGEVSPVDDEERIYEVTDVMPRFPGGNSKLNEWLSAHVKYPKDALQYCIQGRVIVRFVVRKDGSIGEVKVVRGIYPSLDNEAVRVVKTLPRFEPGEKDGRVIDVWFTLPVSFRLEQENVL